MILNHDDGSNVEDVFSSNGSALPDTSLLQIIPAKNALKVFNFINQLKRLKKRGVEEIDGDELRTIAVKVFGQKVNSLSWEGQDDILLSIIELLEIPESAKDVARDSILALTNFFEED